MRSFRFHAVQWILAVSVVFHTAQADTKSNILRLTNNARTKLVWVRWPWCDHNYNPIQAYRVESNNDNSHQYTQLMAFDTDDGAIKYLDSTIGSHCYPRLTRRDGSHVIWNDNVNKCSWIRNFAGTSPRRKLLDGGDYFVGACRYDPAIGSEFLYVISADKNTIYRMTLRPDYTVNPADKTPVYRGADVNVKVADNVSSSADGRYLGVQIPWPSCQILDVAGAQLLMRRAEGAFGCQPNIAPDNSYRFFHLRDCHRIIRMWSDNLGTDNWDVFVNRNMPGNNADHDCAIPRWSNNPRFFTNAYPLITGFVPHWGAPEVFNMSAAQLRNADPSNAGTFVLGKFSQDYRSVEEYVFISGGDVRFRDVNGDAWIAGSSDVTPPTAPANLRGSAENESVIMLSWDAATDAESGILEYNVYRGTRRIATVKQSPFRDSLLTERTEYVYQVSALNSAGLEGPKSTAVTVRTQADTRPPAIVAAYALEASTKITVVFSEAVAKSDAENIANYAIDKGVTVVSAVLGLDSISVVLTVSAMTPGTQYTLTVNNIRDRAQNPNTITPNSRTSFTHILCGDGFDVLDTVRWKQALRSTTANASVQNGNLVIKAVASSHLQSGLWPDQNNFSAVYRTDLAGDFDVWVKAVAPPREQWSQQGIVVANNLANPSAGGFCAVSLNYAVYEGYVFYVDQNAPLGQMDQRFQPGSLSPVFPSWLRLERRGNQFSAYFSTVGPFGWIRIGEAVTISSASANLQIGLFGTSSTSVNQATVYFDAFGCTQAAGQAVSAVVGGDDQHVFKNRLGRIDWRGGRMWTAGASSIKAYEVVTPCGRVVARQRFQDVSQAYVPIRPARPGVYIVRLWTNADVIRGTVVVENDARGR